MAAKPNQRRCARCGQLRPICNFGKKQRRPNDYQSYCRTCQSAYHHEHYLKNKEAYYLSVQRRYQRLREHLRALKDKPCADGGIKYPYYVMDFDHREGQKKIGDIARFLKMHSKRALLEEIAKCDVVCANCHRERTHQRKQRAMRLDEWEE
jgi:hypothetical protein